MTKTELDKVINLNYKVVKPRRDVKKALLKNLADEIMEGAWQRFARRYHLVPEL